MSSAWTDGAAAGAGARTLAVVVTYNPDDSLETHLRALRSQVDTLLVVDNGSCNRDDVARAVLAAGGSGIYNVSNLGIAAALNQAVDVVLRDGHDWLAMFDQDSLAPPGLVAGLLRLYAEQPQKAQVGMVCATHVDRHTGSHYHVPQHVLEDSASQRVLRTAITSGSMVPAAVFRVVGRFDESLFIDFVDHDFCLRCRQHGLRIVESKRDVLTHSLGALSEHRFLWRRVVVSNHSPLRRYYMTRNQLEVYTRYARFDPGWSIRGLFNLAVGSVFVLVFETQRWAKLQAMARGLAHFARRRFGAWAPPDSRPWP